jgi:hypothetical protein
MARFHLFPVLLHGMQHGSVDLATVTGPVLASQTQTMQHTRGPVYNTASAWSAAEIHSVADELQQQQQQRQQQQQQLAEDVL